MSELTKSLIVALIASIVAAYPVQKVGGNAPTLVLWVAWLALTLGLFLLLRPVLAKRPARRSD
jgi:hypothetical protein